MTRNWNHIEVLNDLEFVHRRLPTGDSRIDTNFVPKTQFVDDPALIVTVTMERTTLWVNNGPWDDYEVKFDSTTPPSILRDAVIAAMQHIS